MLSNKLHIAIKYNCFYCVKSVLEQGVSITNKDLILINKLTSNHIKNLFNSRNHIARPRFFINVLKLLPLAYLVFFVFFMSECIFVVQTVVFLYLLLLLLSVFYSFYHMLPRNIIAKLTRLDQLSLDILDHNVLAIEKWLANFSEVNKIEIVMDKLLNQNKFITKLLTVNYKPLQLNKRLLIVNLLLNKLGENISTDKIQQWLLFAVNNNYTAIVKVLLSKFKGSINFQDLRGNTLLHLASQQGNIDLVNLLLRQNYIDLKIINNNSQIAADVATQVCRQIILRHSCKI